MPFDQRFQEAIHVNEKVQVGKDQEKAQSEKDSHSKNQGGKTESDLLAKTNFISH